MFLILKIFRSSCRRPFVNIQIVSYFCKMEKYDFFFAQLRHLRHENFIRFNKFYGIVQQLEQNFIHPYNWMITSILLNICKCGTNINGKIWLKRILKSSLNFFLVQIPKWLHKKRSSSSLLVMRCCLLLLAWWKRI